MNLLDNLTGEARGKFKSWFIENITLKTGRTIQESIGWSDIYKLPPSMQIGVLIDWAESEGYYLGYTWWSLQKTQGELLDNCFDFFINAESNKGIFITRHEAYEASVKKLNELIN